VNSLYQTCWQLGTNSANTTCWRLVSRPPREFSGQIFSGGPMTLILS
jgi:hypothetical protein